MKLAHDVLELFPFQGRIVQGSRNNQPSGGKSFSEINQVFRTLVIVRDETGDNQVESSKPAMAADSIVRSKLKSMRGMGPRKFELQTALGSQPGVGIIFQLSSVPTTRSSNWS